MTDQPRPEGLADAGTALWDAVTDVLDLVELRQQRITFARLVSAMQLPTGLADAKQPAAQPQAPAGEAQQRTQRRPGVRGVYAIDGGRA